MTDFFWTLLTSVSQSEALLSSLDQARSDGWGILWLLSCHMCLFLWISFEKNVSLALESWILIFAFQLTKTGTAIVSKNPKLLLWALGKYIIPDCFILVPKWREEYEESLIKVPWTAVHNGQNRIRDQMCSFGYIKGPKMNTTQVL